LADVGVVSKCVAGFEDEGVDGGCGEGMGEIVAAVDVFV
jgi:hypothetical protein